MNIRFVFVLLAVEICALIFGIIHIVQSKMDVYNTYNAIPITYNTSKLAYICFASVNHCVYEDHEHLVFKLAHLAFIIITIFSYVILLIIMKTNLEGKTMNNNTKITWYSVFEFLIEICLVINTLLLIFLYYLERMSTNKCYAANLVQYENLLSYIVLNILEGAYIGFDILKRQATQPQDAHGVRGQVARNQTNVLERKFVFVLLTVEICALIFGIIHIVKGKMDVYDTDNAIPITYNTSTQTYTCFTSVNHCVYDDQQHLGFKIVHLTFIIITIFSYVSLMIIIKENLEEETTNNNTKIIWYSRFELIVEICLVINTILLIILFYLERMNINECYTASCLIWYENLMSYIVLNILEGTYIGIDILARQAKRQRENEKLQQQVDEIEFNKLGLQIEVDEDEFLVIRGSGQADNANDGNHLLNHDNMQHANRPRDYGTISRDVIDKDTADPTESTDH